MKIKKVIGVMTSAVMSLTLFGQAAVFAEDSVEWETSVYRVVMRNVIDDSTHTQWYTSDETKFRSDGLYVECEGVDVTNDSTMTFPEGTSPLNTYDYQNFDYEFPVTVSHGGNNMDASVIAKIGRPGDVNADHLIDVRDPALISRDITKYRSTKKSTIPAFGRFLATGNRNESYYDLKTSTASGIAAQLADESINDHKRGNNAEKSVDGSPYSLSLSNAAGVPGEQVTIQVVVSAGNSFEGLDAVIDWGDSVVDIGQAFASGGTTVRSAVGDGIIAIIDYGDKAINNGAVASVNFTIPEDAVPGETIDVNFSELRTFSVLASDGTSQDVSDMVSVKGTSVKVNQPAQTQPVTTTAPVTTSTVAATTVSAVQTTAAASSAPAATTAAATKASSAPASTAAANTSSSQTTVSDASTTANVTETKPASTTIPKIIIIPEITTITEPWAIIEPGCYMSVVSPPNKTKYAVGEELDLTGLAVDVYFDPSEEVPESQADEKSKITTKVMSKADPTENPDMFTVDTSAVNMSAPGKYKVTIGLTQAAQNMFWDCSPVTVDIEVADKQVTTVSSTAVTSASTQTTTVTTVTTPAVKYEQGDANLDGNINVYDAAFIATMIARNKTANISKYADFNGDGVVNVKDAVDIAKWIAANKPSR